MPSPLTHRSSPTLVRKYGGSSLASAEQFQRIAKDLANLARAGHQIVVVVSARGKTTDELIRMAREVSPSPDRRELDMLVSVGERISMALMAMAIRDTGAQAISFTGSQAGILTSQQYTNAFVRELRPTRVEQALASRSIVVLAGFQGVSPDTKEITTLGRGGSDVTAVAMAAHFQADACEICKDVDGVYSADPKVVPAPFHRSNVTSQALLDMTFWGAKLLHYRSVELAVVHRVPLVIRLAHPNHAEERMTRMTQSQDHDRNGPTPTVVSEKPGVLSLNSLAEVRRISLTGAHPANALESLRLSLQDADLPLPQILNISPSESGWSILFSAPAESLSLQVERLRRTPSCVVDSANWCTVTATCQGLFSSALSEDLTVLLKDAGLSVSQVLFGAMSITWVLPQSQREMAIKTLHSSALCRPEAAEELDRAGLR